MIRNVRFIGSRSFMFQPRTDNYSASYASLFSSRFFFAITWRNIYTYTYIEREREEKDVASKYEGGREDDAVIVMRRFIAFTGGGGRSECSEFPFISGIHSRRSRQRRQEDLSRIIAGDLASQMYSRKD